MSSSKVSPDSQNRTYIDSVSALCERILQIRENSAEHKRVLIAVAGAPGSGKSTLAESLPALLDPILAENGEASVVVPMDGFHLDNAVLDAHDLRAVKGSPATFDVAGFASLLERIAIRGEAPIYVPVFDRSIDLARNASQEVSSAHSVAVVEGNYLLLDQPGWCDLSDSFDCTIMLEVPLETLESRLIERWLNHGHTADEARQRALSNDIPNARTVLAESIPADLYYESVRQ